MELERVELFRAGQNNELILVYGGLIFRFPKFVEGVEWLRREDAVLSALRPRVSPLMDQCWGRVRFYAACAFLLDDAL